MGWLADAVEQVGAVAAGPLDAWADLVTVMQATTADALMAAAASAVSSVLEPGKAGDAGGGAALRFAEQVTADVSAVTGAQRQEAVAELGADALQFVQAVWVLDMATRGREAFSRLFGDPVLAALDVTSAPSGGDPWPAQERFLREVAMVTSLDPVTSEMVRLRGARAHACRLCQSLRSRTATRAAGDVAMFESVDSYESSDLPERTKVALRVVDVFVWQPMSWPEPLAEQVRSQFSPAEAAEIVLDLIRNSSNKIAVAFGADAPHVEDGIEFYDIDYSNGEIVYGLTVD